MNFRARVGVKYLTLTYQHQEFSIRQGFGWWHASEGRSLPDSVYMIQSANHELLFPRCRVIIHHGGSEKVAELNIGWHIPFPKLTNEKLNRTINKGKFFCGVPCEAWICIYVCRFRGYGNAEKVHRAIVF